MDYLFTRLAADHRQTLLDEAAAYRLAKAVENPQPRRSRRSSGRHQLRKLARC